jgi:hypothetical protein
MVAYATRPDELSGCWSTWSEQDVPTTIRSSMDNGEPKVRRRFTGVLRRAQVSVNCPDYDVQNYMYWFRTLCQQGLMPTAMVSPAGVEAVWRFVEPPVVQWGAPGSGMAVVSATIERLPGWQEL